MNPIELYKKADGWIIKRLNDLYLWVMDWTGLYVGTLCFLIGAEQVAYQIHRGWIWWAAFNLLIMTVGIAAPRYYWQATGNQKMFNYVAEQMEEWLVMRHIFIWMYLIGIVSYLAEWKIWPLVDSVLGIFLWYVWCFRIRDREKKEFKVFTPATQGAHGTHS